MSILKTFGENSVTQARIYWKQFEGWVTGLKDKYRTDPFFRTECNIIALQGAFALSLLLFVAFAFNYLYQDIVEMVLTGISESIRSGGNVTGEEILEAAEAAKTQNLAEVIIFTMLVTVVFGYIVARVTLSPARNTLTSQKRFISDIAHELRTPLSVIKTNSEVALLDEGLDARVRRTIKSNIEELDRTSEIINNLLTFSNWVRPERINFTQVDIGPVIDSAVRKLRELAQTRQLEIVIKKRAPHTVWGNATALEQVVTNLLKNAINYTPSGGRITVSLGPDYQGNIVLAVEDTGMGIAPKDLFHIFEPFYRAERSRNRQTGSSGLGLTIVSELVKLHHGKITIKSTVNKGTTAMVLLPFSKDTVASSSREKKSDEISMDFLRR